MDLIVTLCFCFRVVKAIFISDYHVGARQGLSFSSRGSDGTPICGPAYLLDLP